MTMEDDHKPIDNDAPSSVPLNVEDASHKPGTDARARDNQERSSTSAVRQEVPPSASNRDDVAEDELIDHKGPMIPTTIAGPPAGLAHTVVSPPPNAPIGFGATTPILAQVPEAMQSPDSSDLPIELRRFQRRDQDERARPVSPPSPTSADALSESPMVATIASAAGNYARELEQVPPEYWHQRPRPDEPDAIERAEAAGEYGPGLPLALPVRVYDSEAIIRRTLAEVTPHVTSELNDISQRKYNELLYFLFTEEMRLGWN